MPPVIEIAVPPEAAGKRLDAFLAQTRPEQSRSRWQESIKSAQLLLNGQPAGSGQRLRAGDLIHWQPIELEPETPRAEAIPLHILYEDAHLIALNKPPGLVVHPAAGNPSGTLVNALLHHCGTLPEADDAARPGIVHRLDKETSGVLVATKTVAALAALQSQFKSRETVKEYRAVVRGHPRPASGTLDTLIGRHPRHRQKMAVLEDGGKQAITHWRILESYSAAALLECRIETGRTHQIRVHLAHLGFPVVGDLVYGRGRAVPLPAPVPRQMLHAFRLQLRHPVTGAPLVFEAPFFDDMRALIDALRTATVGRL